MGSGDPITKALKRWERKAEESENETDDKQRDGVMQLLALKIEEGVKSQEMCAALEAGKGLGINSPQSLQKEIQPY